jgi:alpha-galactosidase
MGRISKWITLLTCWILFGSCSEKGTVVWVDDLSLVLFSEGIRPVKAKANWNDPDMMVLGNVSIGPEMHPSRLTPDEQYSHVSIFSLLAAPLLIGCPLEQLDEFTMNLLTNDEVLEINQDPLGKPARLLADENGVQIWVKPMEGGSYAVGLFNVDDFGKTPASYFRWGDETAKSFTFNFDKAGLTGNWKLRDVWRQIDLGEFNGSCTCEIRHHGVMMLRMYTVRH